MWCVGGGRGGRSARPSSSSRTKTELGFFFLGGCKLQMGARSGQASWVQKRSCVRFTCLALPGWRKLRRDSVSYTRAGGALM